MDTTLGIAGLLCVLLALGHATLGLVWVLPSLKDREFAPTPFGGPNLTAAAIYASWHIVTVFALSAGVILLWLAIDANVDPKTVVLRVFGGMWLMIAAVASFAGLRRGSRVGDVLRFPVPVFFVVVAILCWRASA